MNRLDNAAGFNEEVLGEDSNTTSIIFNELKKNLTHDVMCDMLAKMNAISDVVKGESGSGLSGGMLIDMFLTEYLSTIFDSYEACHEGESDCKVLNIPISIKKINGKSTIALDWSKNGEDSKKRERFETDIMVVNLKSGKWWKEYPQGATQEEKDSGYYSSTMKAGIYIISHKYCKNNVTLSSNNKTNSLIDNKQLYNMLKESIRENMVLEFPAECPTYKFDILKAFQQ
jgi:hypothetical protein